MTARLYLAPDPYGDMTIWRDTGHDRDEAVLTRTGGNAQGFDALAGLVERAEHNGYVALAAQKKVGHYRRLLAQAGYECSCNSAEGDEERCLAQQIEQGNADVARLVAMRERVDKYLADLVYADVPTSLVDMAHDALLGLTDGATR